MSKFVAMLRGINVSGQKKIKMADLRKYLEEAGFKEVETYIQSGNVVFESEEEDERKLELKVAAVIRNKYGFDVPTVVKRHKDFEYVLNNNPFLKDRGENPDFCYLTFLAETPEELKVEALDSDQYLPEEFIIDGKNIFLFLPKGAGRAKINNNFFEQKLKVKATTRNWRTVKVLLEMSGNKD